MSAKDPRRGCAKDMFFGESFDVKALVCYAFMAYGSLSSLTPSWLKASVGPHYTQRRSRVYLVFRV